MAFFIDEHTFAKIYGFRSNSFACVTVFQTDMLFKEFDLQNEGEGRR